MSAEKEIFQLFDPKSDILAENFKRKTGVDLRDYRKPEIVGLIGDLLSFPLYAAKLLFFPFLAFLLITIILVFFVTGYFPRMLAIAFVPIFSLLNAFTLAAVLMVARLSTDVTAAVSAGLGLTTEVTRDVRNIHLKRENESFEFPSFVEVFNGVMHVVIVPTITVVLDRKIPIIGKLFGGLVRRLASMTTRRTIKNLAAEHAEVLDVDAPEGFEERKSLERLKKLSKIAGTADKVAVESIRWTSLLLLIATSTVFGISLGITVLCYWLIL